MHLASFASALGIVMDQKEPHPEWVAHLGERILGLIDGEQSRWEFLYTLVADVKLEFCPAQVGVPDESDDHDGDFQSVPETLIKHAMELSSDAYFGCEPAVWLAMVGLDRLANGLFMHRLIRRSLDERSEESDREIEQLLPAQIAATLIGCAEALTAAEAFKVQSRLLEGERRKRASQGGIERNRKYNQAREGFISFYLTHRHLSRAEAARRYYRELEKCRTPGEQPLYRNEEAAVRAFTDALRRASI